MKRPKRKHPKYVEEDQSSNGVRVIVTRFYADDGSVTRSTVEADCNCFGHPCRMHSNMSCRALARAQRQAS